MENKINDNKEGPGTSSFGKIIDDIDKLLKRFVKLEKILDDKSPNNTVTSDKYRIIKRNLNTCVEEWKRTKHKLRRKEREDVSDIELQTIRDNVEHDLIVIEKIHKHGAYVSLPQSLSSHRQHNDPNEI